MFRSMTIIRETVLHLAKVIFVLNNSVKLHRYILCGDVAAHVLPHHYTIYNDVILLSVLTQI